MMARQSRAHSRSRGGPTRSRTSYRTGTIEIFTRPHQNPYLRVVGWIVRFRAELTLLFIVGTPIVVQWWRTRPVSREPGTVVPPPAEPVTVLGPDEIAIGWIVVLAVVMALPATRRYVCRRFWAVTDRHRMRACFVQTRTMTHDGKQPLLLWSRPSPIGERVRVWLPAGMSVKDIEQVTDRMAASCWARTARVTPSRSQAALVVVDIVRRDPLVIDEFTPAGVDDLDPDDYVDPDHEGTVVALPSRDALASRKATTTSAGDRPTRTPPATGRTSGKSAQARQPADDEDADPSL